MTLGHTYEDRRCAEVGGVDQIGSIWPRLQLDKLAIETAAHGATFGVGVSSESSQIPLSYGDDSVLGIWHCKGIGRDAAFPFLQDESAAGVWATGRSPLRCGGGIGGAGSSRRAARGV